MLSEYTLSFDIPTQPEGDLLAPPDFDDLLDIAREFEFTRTITHVWPCDEPSTCSQAELDDILAAILPTPNTEETPLPLPSSTVSPSMYHAGSPDQAPLWSDDSQLPSATILQGWSPPNGSQFLDLDASLMLPQSTRDTWMPPWMATFFAPPYTQPPNSISQLPAMAPELQPQTLANDPRTPLATTIDKTGDGSRNEGAPFTPMQSSTCALPESVRARPTPRSNLPNQVATTPRAKIPTSRPHPPSAPAMSAYTKAPRGGIPPHIARTVTKANILRVEKERKVMRDAFSSTTAKQGKKPSVLRRAAKVDGEESNVGDDGGNRKKPSAWGENNEKEARATKRKRV